MSEERLQEIKDSIEFQEQWCKEHDINANIVVKEERELLDEIKRLKKEVEDRNSINLACYMLRDDNRELYSENKKLKSIIKEARKLLKETKILNSWFNQFKKKQLEILDKVEENK